MHKLRALLATFVLLVGIGLVAAAPASAHDSSASGMSAQCDNTDHYTSFVTVIPHAGYKLQVGWHPSTSGKYWWCAVLFVIDSSHGTARWIGVSIQDLDQSSDYTANVGSFAHFAGPVKAYGCSMSFDSWRGGQFGDPLIWWASTDSGRLCT